MSEKVCVKELLKSIKTSDFVRNCPIPLGYVTGYPMLGMYNGQPVMTVPFLRYKVTGQVDKTLVFPIHYTVTVALPSTRILAFQDLSADRRFQKVDFGKPIGFFRHEAVKSLSKTQFAAKREALFAAYDKIIAAMVAGRDYTPGERETMADLLKMLAEPCLMPIYQALEPAFYAKFLG